MRALNAQSRQQAAFREAGAQSREEQLAKVRRQCPSPLSVGDVRRWA